MTQTVRDSELRRLFDAFNELPEGRVKVSMRGILRALPTVLDDPHAARLILSRIQQGVAVCRRKDPLARFDRALRMLRRQLEEDAA